MAMPPTSSRALLFPGQGSQGVGMGRALCETFPVARAVFDEADAALGFSLSRLCFEGPEDALTLTAHAQPAILTTSVAALRVLQEEGSVAGVGIAAGHSLGEYSALVAAGALTVADAVRLVHLRGRFMQDAVPQGMGAMAAILGLEGDAVAEICAGVAKELDQVVSPANLNGGGQVVIAGTAAAVERAQTVCKEQGAKRAIPLKVSAPFHCALMQPAAERLAEALAKVTISPLAFPVVTNVGGSPNQDPERVRALLVRQVTAPVEWERSVQAIARAGFTVALELGAGKVLAGLVKRIAPELAVTSLGEPDGVRAFLAFLARSENAQ